MDNRWIRAGRIPRACGALLRFFLSQVKIWRKQSVFSRGFCSSKLGPKMRRLYRTNGLLSRIKYRNRGIWCVWPTCGSSVMRRDISNNTQGTTLDTNPNPNPDPAPTHINFVRQKSGIFLFGNKLVDHTKRCIIKYSPISILYPRE